MPVLTSSGRFGNMMKLDILFGLFFGFMSVLLGAFASHGLKSKVSPEDLAIFEIGVRYQMYHALALLFLGLFKLQNGLRDFQSASWLFIFGVFLFSGSLYALTFFKTKFIGILTPIGGSLLLTAWGVAFYKVLGLKF